MKDKGIRLDALEKIFIAEPLIVLAENPNTGETVEMTCKEMIDRGYGFCRVVRGGSPGGKDIQTLLDYMAFSNAVEPGGGFLTTEFQEKANSEEFKARKAAKEAEIAAYNNLTIADKIALLKESED